MRAILCLVLLATLAATTTSARADDDWWTRKTLADYEGSPKRELAEKGVDVSFDVTNFLQGLQNGPNATLANGGKVDFRFRLDGQKLGLWQGFFVSSHIEYNYGTNVNQAARGLNIIPINTALAYPSLNDSMFSLLFTQAFSPTTTVTAGLFNMFDAASARPLVGGGGINTFWNLALAAPLTNITPPYIYGISFNTRQEIGSFGLFVYDARDAQNLNNIRDLFSDGVVISATASFPVTIAGLGGFQNVRLAFSTQDGTDLSSLPPEVNEPPAFKSNRWYLQYSFEQFFVQDPENPKVGWGLFGQYGYSDGNPNAFQGHGFLGLAGNNMMAGRQNDRWGIGYYSYQMSDAFVNSLPGVIGSRLERNKGAEIFYNMAVTPWFRLAFDAQWSRPYNGIDDNYYLGMSAQIKFF